MNPEWIGYIAAVFTTAAYVPQTIKTLRERHTSSLSLSMYVLVSFGGGFWLAYGILTGSPSLILANSLTLLMTVAILLLKIRHG